MSRKPTSFVEYALQARAAISAMLLQTRVERQERETRSGLAALTRMFRSAEKQNNVVETINGINEQALAFEAITGAYLTPNDIRAGKSGDFDALNVLSWLEIAKMGNIPHVPARVIASLTADEASAVSGDISEPLLKKRKLTQILSRHTQTADDTAGEEGQETDTATLRDIADNKLIAGMDTVSENEMVRYSRSGTTSLKAIAGAGLSGPTAPRTIFNNTIETGPGWLRIGNHRRIDMKDNRIIAVMASTPDSYIHDFIARPWVASSRYLMANDIHREETPFAGPGAYPAEWRVFIANGKVVGVSSYYSWAHQGTPKDARMALAAAELATQIVETAISHGLRPAFYDTKVLADAMAMENSPLAENEHLKNWIADHDPSGFCATIDFIETPDGLLFLEAGCGICPLGGGAGAHPIALGTGMKMERFAYPNVHGIALKSPANMRTSSPKDMENFDRAETVMTWDEAKALALQES